MPKAHTDKFIWPTEPKWLVTTLKFFTVVFGLIVSGALPKLFEMMGLSSPILLGFFATPILVAYMLGIAYLCLKQQARVYRWLGWSLIASTLFITVIQLFDLSF